MCRRFNSVLGHHLPTCPDHHQTTRPARGLLRGLVAAAAYSLDYESRLAVHLVATGWLFTIAPSDGATIGARVVAVSDGDTITVQFEDKRRIRIRLQGIDAAERTQPYSQVGRRSLHEMTMGKFVTFDTEKIDRHGRAVAVVRVKGKDVCLAQIQAGLAWHFKRYEMEQTPEERSAYAAAEAIAKAARRGLWRDDAPLAPWEFRARVEQSIPTN